MIIAKKFLYYIIGSIILSLGITLSITAKLGAGAFDAHNSNLAELLGITIGQAMYLSIIILYLISMLIKPKVIFIIGVLLTSIIGFGIDFWAQIITLIDDSIGVKLIYFGASLIFLPLGVTFIIKSRLPLSPVDNIMILLVAKTKWSVGLIKTLIEGSFAVLAFGYGMMANIGVGSLSIGTIVITFTIGPGIEFFKKFVKDI